MRRLLVVTVAWALILGLAPVVYASTPEAVSRVTVSQLTGRVFDGDGDTVAVTGEVIGEALREGRGRVWVNILDAGTAIGVVVEADDVRAIEAWGDYDHTGDSVLVTGVFHVACDEHGGDMDIHATSLEVIEPGATRQHPLEWYKGVVGLGALAVAAVAVRRSRRIRAEREGM